MLRRCLLSLPSVTRGQRHYRAIIREIQPSPITIHVDEGEQIISPPKETLTEVEESTEEFKFVERLLPRATVPEPPEHKSYPTPSGWVPQTASAGNLPYFIKRTRFHNFPIYLEVLNGGNRKMTMIKYVEGDIWTFESDMRAFIQEKINKKVYTQVDEVCRKVRIRGIHMEDACEFMLSKGL